MTVKNSIYFLGFYVSFYWRAQWKWAFCIIIFKKTKPKTQNNSPRGIRKERHTRYTATTEGPLDESLFFLKNKAILYFDIPSISFMNSWLFSRAFPAVHPETFVLFDFHSSRSAYAPLNFCILSCSFLLFCFSPISKFINNIKLSSPPPSLASRSPLSAFPSVQHHSAHLCSEAISSFTDEKGNNTNQLFMYLVMWQVHFNGIISHIHGTESQLPINVTSWMLCPKALNTQKVPEIAAQNHLPFCQLLSPVLSIALITLDMTPN